jgi:ABC-type multidrug transport system fused ATPase/permease subunit
MNLFLKVFSIFTRKERWYCLGLFCFMIIGVIFETIGIGAILPLISVMGDSDFLQKHELLKQFLANIGIINHTQFIIYSAVALVGFYILKNIFMIVSIRLQIKFAYRSEANFVKRAMSLYLSKPYVYHLNKNTAEILRNVNSSIPAVFSVLVVTSLLLLTEICTAIAIWLMLMFVDVFTATVVAFVLGAFVYSLIKIIKTKLANQGSIQQFYGGEMLKWVNQGLGSIKETKVSRKEAFFLEQFARAYEKYNSASYFFSFTSQLPRFLIETVVTTGLLILIIVKLLLGYTPNEIVPVLGVLSLAAFRMMPSANRIVNYFNTIRFYIPVFNSVYDDLITIKENNSLDCHEVQPNVYSQLTFNNEIVIKNLSFQYPQGSQMVLNEVGFKVPKGAFVGIIGQTGAGKTTFVDILLGLLEPTRGSIYVDGCDIFKDIRSWQTKLAYVPQSIYLIDGTIKENVALGILEQDVDEIKLTKVLKMAELFDFVYSLPDQLDTKVGERGVKLSGGQRQRIGIARALYYDPEVLILDEATSALDNDTEKNITSTILKLKGRITIIAIAHRVSTLEECDFRVKFERGKARLLG